MSARNTQPADEPLEVQFANATPESLRKWGAASITVGVILIGVVLVLYWGRFGGQAFIPEVLPKIGRLRAMCDRRGLSPVFEVDGGENTTTAGQAAAAGATAIVAGSAIFGAKDYAVAIAAIRAAQLGFSVACIDEWANEKGGPAPGGTCTNVGCIPSKALLQSSEHFDHAAHGFKEHGINVEGLSFDVAQMLKRKNTVVKQNNDGILFLFKKNKITFFHGRGAFAGAAGAEGYPIAITEKTISAEI